MNVRRLLLSPALIVLLVPAVGLLLGCGDGASTTTTVSTGSGSTSTEITGEVEATEFQGVRLTPMGEQRNNALAGTQVIDGDTYRLVGFRGYWEGRGYNNDADVGGSAFE